MVHIMVLYEYYNSRPYITIEQGRLVVTASKGRKMNVLVKSKNLKKPHTHYGHPGGGGTREEGEVFEKNE